MSPLTQDSKTFTRNAQGIVLPTVENFYNYCGERRLMGIKCKKCGELMCPPRPVCRKCLSTEYEWIEFKGEGELSTYTIIHFAPTQFQLFAPYAVGIVKLDDGPYLPGMIKNLKLEEIRIGTPLQVDYETAVAKEWPTWTRYFFKPA